MVPFLMWGAAQGAPSARTCRHRSAALASVRRPLRMSYGSVTLIDPPACPVPVSSRSSAVSELVLCCSIFVISVCSVMSLSPKLDSNHVNPKSKGLTRFNPESTHGLTQVNPEPTHGLDHSTPALRPQPGIAGELGRDVADEGSSCWCVVPHIDGVCQGKSYGFSY